MSQLHRSGCAAGRDKFRKPNVTDDKQRIEFAKWHFERTLHWITTADSKVGVTMALVTAMLGGLAAAFAASDAAERTAWGYLAALSAAGTLVMSVFCAGMATIPRTQGPLQSLIFFARIQEYPIEEYVSNMEQLTEKQLLNDLARQIHRNAQIACDKHSWVRKSLLWAFWGAVPWAIAIVMFVKT